MFSYNLSSRFELELVDIFLLARKSNGFSLEVDYQIVKDYCKAKKYDFLEVYRILKGVNSKLND